NAMAGGNAAPPQGALAWLGEVAGRLGQTLAVPPAWALVPPLVGLLVVFRRANSNALVEGFRPTFALGAFVAIAVPLCVLQLARPTPFLYFNF
ncbi:MAG TPA: hypothetical protein VET86_06465, partial [Casimicrobiaceae bacterium]|nr:hypothetical protein [Casimicrobiaceae bacterium]